MYECDKCGSFSFNQPVGAWSTDEVILCGWCLEEREEEAIANFKKIK